MPDDDPRAGNDDGTSTTSASTSSATTSSSTEDEDVLPYPGFVPVALYYFDQTKPPRTWCLKLVTNPWFERVSMLVILLNCVTLGMFQPCADGECVSGRCRLLQVCDDLIFAFFALEMCVKVLAMGFMGNNAYLAETWNRLDFFIVIAGALEYCLDVGNINLSAIRTIRVLRPLRAINRIPSMRILVMLLLDTLPMLGNVLLLCFFVFFIFGIVGVQLWAGLLRQRCYLVLPDENISFPSPISSYYQGMDAERDYICSSDKDNGMHRCSDLPPLVLDSGLVCNASARPHSNNVPTNASCVNWNQYYSNCTAGDKNPFQGSISFDNIGLAWVAIFLVISLEGWSDIMYYVQDAHSFWDWIYFVLLIVIGSFFMINLCLVVIATQFSETKKREMERMRQERARYHSTSTLASTSVSDSGCYTQIIKYLTHLGRRAKRRFLRWYRRRRRRRARRRAIREQGATSPGSDSSLRRVRTPSTSRHRDSHRMRSPTKCLGTGFPPVNNNNNHQHHIEEPCYEDGESICSGESGSIMSSSSSSSSADSATAADNGVMCSSALSPEAWRGAPQASPELSDVDLGASPRRPSCLRVHPRHCLSNPTGSGGAVERSMAPKQQSGKNVSLQAPQSPPPEPRGSAGPGAGHQHPPTTTTAPTLTCAELLAFSGAQSAALAASLASNFAMHTFYSTLSKGTKHYSAPQLTFHPPIGSRHCHGNTTNTTATTTAVVAADADNDTGSVSSSSHHSSCSHEFSGDEEDSCSEYEDELSSGESSRSGPRPRGACYNFWMARQAQLRKLVDHQYFQRGILTAILVNTLSMGIEYHDQPQELTLAVEISNLVFTGIFGLEMLLKILAEGFFTYISSGFNLFDGVIVILSIVELCQSSGSGLSVLRTFRLLRILKLVRFMPALRRQLFIMLRTMDNVAVFFALLILFIFIFSILGMNLFGCKFCVKEPDGTVQCDRKNFDSLLWALVTVFQILTQEDWNVVLFNGMEKTSPWAALYFVALMTFGNYVLFNLLVAILVEGFSAEGDRKKSLEALKENVDGNANNSRKCNIQDADDDPKDNIMKETRMLSSHPGAGSGNCGCGGEEALGPCVAPPIITHTAATPQGSPNATLEPLVRELNNRLSPLMALAAPDSTNSERSMLSGSSPMGTPRLSRTPSNRSTASHALVTAGTALLNVPRQGGSNAGGGFVRNDTASPGNPRRRRRSCVSPAPFARKEAGEGPLIKLTRQGSGSSSGWQQRRRGDRSPCLADSDSDSVTDVDQDGDSLVPSPLQPPLNNAIAGQSTPSSDHSHCNGGLPSTTINNHGGATYNNHRSPNNNNNHKRQNILTKQNNTNAGSPPKPTATVAEPTAATPRDEKSPPATPPSADGSRKASLTPQGSLLSRHNSLQSQHSAAFSRHNSLSSAAGSYLESRHNSLVCKPSKKLNLEGSMLHVKVDNAAAAALALGERTGNVPKLCWFFEPQWWRWCFENRQDYSLFIFSPESKARAYCNHMTRGRWFDYTVLVFIALNCITLAMERPNIPPKSLEREVLIAANYTFTVVFAFEMLVKVIAKGLWYGKKAYFNSGWNKMDGVLVLISLVDFFLTFVADGSPRIFGILRVFRLLRSLRPLRVINRAPGLKLVVQTLMSSLRPIGNIVLICCTFFIIFGILGVQLFKGSFYFCEGPDVKGVKTKEDCLARGMVWTNRKYNFDHLGQALMALFVLSSKDGWVNIMYSGLDAVAEGVQPVENYNEWRLLYFISFLLLVAFFVLNMFVGVVVENFHRCREEQEREERALRAAKRARKLEKKRRKMREPPYYANYSKPRLFTHNIVTSKYFDLAIAAVIGLNVVTMAMEFYRMPVELEYALKIFNYFFTAVFLLELSMKVVALGIPRYLVDKWNQLDILIVILSIMGIVLEEMKSDLIPINPTIIRVMRVLRIARVLKLLKMAKGIRALLDTVMQALPQVGNLGLLFFLLFFIFAALGVELFGRLECDESHPCQGLGEHAHFHNFGMAFLTLFRVATGDNWNGIMKDTLRDECDSRSDCVRNCCVSPIIAPLYFVVFVLMAQFVLVNVVVAVLMKHLEESHKQQDDDLDMEAELQEEMEQELLEAKNKLALEAKIEFHKPIMKMSSLPANFTFYFQCEDAGGDSTQSPPTVSICIPDQHERPASADNPKNVHHDANDIELGIVPSININLRQASPEDGCAEKVAVADLRNGLLNAEPAPQLPPDSIDHDNDDLDARTPTPDNPVQTPSTEDDEESVTTTTSTSRLRYLLPSYPELAKADADSSESWTFSAEFPLSSVTRTAVSDDGDATDDDGDPATPTTTTGIDTGSEESVRPAPVVVEGDDGDLEVVEVATPSEEVDGQVS
ncbi:voltage-dependent T-type calcium channel subunit alpha-1G-like isoform X2 [Ornithodoros turicata]|uniref:voltage-dependent T-type calcium channel subunit alpha-1G-like isoform X2 n=1 Tax=Ornithodoros turicata TaxID=34597 RepID=UPI003138AAAB